MKLNRSLIIRMGILVLIFGILFPLLPNADAASLYTVKSSSTTTLAPGITQTIRTLSYGDGTNSVKCYVATADLNRGDVVVLNGYKDNAPAYNGCGTVTVDQQIIASNKVHQDPNDARYIENYRVVAGCNGGFFNIPGITGITGFKGALVMEGVQYWEYDNRPFLAILKDGSVVVGQGASDWNKYREHMQETIGGNVLLVKNGQNNTGNVNLNAAFVGQENDGLGTKRHPRTCVGVTQDGKVVMMVVDAQTTATAGTRGGATLKETAQMLIDAGCYYAINMDGGGSSTYMTMAEGATTPTLVNKPSGGTMRAICGSLLFASTAPTDHLSFEFDGTGADRYMTGLYCKRNYDLPGHWATGLSGTGAGDTAPTVNTSTGLMTVNLTKREGSHSTYLALGAMNGTFDQAQDTNAVSLSFVPRDAELLRIRLKLKDAKRYSATDTPFVGFSYLSGDTKTWSGNICQLTIPDAYLDGGAKEDTFLTLTMDLTNSKLRDCSKIHNIMLQIGNLREGGAFIDQIYLGPKSGRKLNFDFAEDPNKSSFFNDPAYNYQNFDREMYWYKGPEISSMDINHGAMTLSVDNACGNIYEAYVETVLSNKNPTQPLRYTPKAGDVIRVRYWVESYDATLNSATYGASQKPTITLYAFHDRQYVYKTTEQLALTTSGRDYTVAQWTVPTEWTSYDISKLRITLRYFQNSTIKIDSIYVGPKDQAAYYDRMYIGFNNAETDRTRYGSTIYGGMNLDKIGSWSVGSEYKPPVISGGVLKLMPNTGYDGYGYAHTGAQTGTYPLSFVPKSEYYLQVRFKVENAVARNLYESKTGIGRFVLYYGNGSVGARNNFMYHEFKVAEVTDKGWILITYPLNDLPVSGINMTAMGGITSLSPCFNWISSASGKTAAMYLDYIYIGPRGGMPNPQYTVTFKDGNGGILQTNTVYKGQSVAYSGPSPKKDPDANYHYTFKSWDKSASNITADTVITAQFNAVSHSYTYASADDANHRATCSCGYSKLVPHSITYTSVDSTNHRASCACGYSRLIPHSFSYSATEDHNTHKRSCSCGYADTTEGHQYSFAKYSAQQHTRSCGKCGFVDQADHIFTYTSTGTVQHKRYCKWCGYEDAVAHEWDKGVVVTAPTCTATGSKTYTCTLCKGTKTEILGTTPHTEVVDKAVVPTCTAPGKSTGRHCSVCNIVLIPQQTIPATGHTPIYTPKDGDYHTVTCHNCLMFEDASHSYTEGLCVCGQVEIKEPVKDPNLKLNHSLNLASDISVNLVVSKTLLEGFDLSTVYVECTLDTYEGNVKTGTQTIRIDPVDNGNFYYFTVDGLTAVQMKDNISSVLYGIKNGQPYYSPVDDYSIASYAYAQLNKAGITQTLKTLCADLLRYGAKAQIFKAYRTDSLADAAMTEEHRAYLSDIEAVTFGNTNRVLNDLPNASITWAGKALNLESKVALKFIFNLGSYTGTLSDLSLRVSYEDAYGKVKTELLTEPEPYGQGTGMYAFTFNGFLAAELRSVVSVRIYAGNTPVSSTLQYSADTYGNNKTGALLELCKALIAYSDSAKVYFVP